MLLLGVYLRVRHGREHARHRAAPACAWSRCCASAAELLCLIPPVAAVIQGPFWFTTKILVFLFFYVWMRGTLPRFRYDQLMSFGWKLLLPVSLANLVITAFVIILPLLVRHR